MTQGKIGIADKVGKPGKMKRGKKIMTILAVILGAIISLNLIGFAANRTLFANELNAIAPYGEIVTVNGQKMHVYAMGHSKGNGDGNGRQTIVLLPGFGVSLPSADFGPLMRELSQEYTVVCVEYFGVGFSDQVKTARTNANIVEETRTALSLAGFKAPYILMPHSVSGVYSEYYAAKYPEEVSAIIMLDTTATARQEGKNPPRFVYGIAKLQQACGLTRLTYGLMPPGQKAENGYTAKEISDYKLFAYHVLNDTMIDQSLRTLDSINEVSAMPFPQEIPVLKLISSQSLAKVGADYQEKHLARLGSTIQSQTIEGSHFIYQTSTAKIYELTKAFLAEVQK